ncbi:hypothetical protein RvY_14927 [Ramazzottius varieornatus]|uniref:Uncharacterized protein n=1 Tax=Ramazzottius varieornatus TaxID=947166 RepID=A0A1D1VSZ7_RAMVA|nr:hypothetical protein RvY_14927 [Ramazzottius varieornatus]
MPNINTVEFQNKKQQDRTWLGVGEFKVGEGGYGGRAVVKMAETDVTVAISPARAMEVNAADVVDVRTSGSHPRKLLGDGNEKGPIMA